MQVNTRTYAGRCNKKSKGTVCNLSHSKHSGIFSTKIGLLDLFSLFCAFRGGQTLICSTVAFGASSGTNSVDYMSDYFNTQIFVILGAAVTIYQEKLEAHNLRLLPCNLNLLLLSDSIRKYKKEPYKTINEQIFIAKYFSGVDFL